MASEESQVIGCHTIDEWRNQLAEAKDSKKLVVVDFTASWCGPCRFIAPVFAEFSNKFPHVVFLKVEVDVDELKSVAENFKVEAMPTFLFLKEGNVVDRVVGARKEDLHDKITTLAGAVATA